MAKGKIKAPQGGSGVVKPKKGQKFGGIATNRASFTRPADTTAYASGDLVANNVTAGSVVPMTLQSSRGVLWSGSVRRARVQKSTNVLTGATFRVHLYASTTAPTVANGDNGVWLSTGYDKYLGAFDVVVDKAFNDPGAAGQGGPLVGLEVNFTLQAGERIYGLLEARGAYTPGSAEVFTVYLEMAG